MMMGLPNELAKYVLTMALVCVPVSFFAPAVFGFVTRIGLAMRKSQI